MITPKAFSFMALILIVGLFLSFIMGGVWFDSTHQSLLNSLTAFKMYNVLGLFKIPWVNVDFFTIGLPNLLKFNFAFFNGTYGLFQYGLYILSIGVIWGLVSVMIGVIYNFWQRAR